MRLLFPTNKDDGLISKRGAHFGKANYYTIVTIQNDVITDIEGFKNQGHKEGACTGAVLNIVALKVDALIVDGIGNKPAQGFMDVGLDVYFDQHSITVEDSVKIFMDKKLKKSIGLGTCTSH